VAIDVRDSTSTREQEEGFAEPPSPSLPRPARTGYPHAASSALTSLAATAGRGEYQAAVLAATGKPAPRHFIEGRCRQRHPDRDPPRIWEEAADHGLPDAVPEHQGALSPYHLKRGPRPRALPSLPTTTAGQDQKDERRREHDQRDEALIEENHRGGGARRRVDRRRKGRRCPASTSPG
jgi:hypothetical protein